MVDRCDLAYIAHYTRHYGIGQIEKGRDTIKSGETGIFVGGHDNAFLNCSVRFSAGTGFHVRGYHHTIHNCLIDEVSYVGHYLNAITDAVSDFGDYEHFLVGGHVITFNTMRNAGRHFFNFYGNGTSIGLARPRAHGLRRHAVRPQPPLQRHAADARRGVPDGLLLPAAGRSTASTRRWPTT